MVIIKPCEELRPYVRYYWFLKQTEPVRALTYPIGCTQIIFHRGSPLYIPETDTYQSRFTISGQVNFPAHIQSAEMLDMIVAVFHPHSIGMFIDTPPSAFYNQEISGYDLENGNLNDMAHQILENENSRECIRLLEQWLLTRVRDTLNTHRIACTLRRLFSDPSISIKCLAEKACLSRKQFERVFRDSVGMNPKEYCRVVKFQKAMRLMQTGRTDWIDVALQSGYADQSHFIREFKRLSAHTPGELLKHSVPYSDLFTNPV